MSQTLRKWKDFGRLTKRRRLKVKNCVDQIMAIGKFRACLGENNSSFWLAYGIHVSGSGVMC
jgi:hypothetical protein